MLRPTAIFDCHNALHTNSSRYIYHSTLQRPDDIVEAEHSRNSIARAYRVGACRGCGFNVDDAL